MHGAREHQPAADFREGFLSDFIGMRVMLRGNAGPTPIATVVDFLVEHPQDTFPRIDAVKLKTRTGMWIVPVAEMSFTRRGPLQINRTPTLESPGDDAALYLVEDLLDKQIVDVDGRKVVRINDLELAMTAGVLRVVAAEVGVGGLLRRLGLGHVARNLIDRVPRTLIAWNNVAPIYDLNPNQIKLSVSGARLARLHPSDLAEIVGDLSAQDAARVVRSLDDETAADALEHMDAEQQRAIIDDLGTQRAADIIEEMDSDDAADLLGDLSQERQAELLAEMQAETADDLRGLVRYGERSAGGLMTTDYLRIYPHRTLSATIDTLREIAPQTEFIYYLFVVDETDTLLGVLSLRTLLLGRPDATIDEMMVTDIVSVSVQTRGDAVAAMIARYDLLACPVLDDNGKIVGIVTVDDAIDAILPDKVKRKLPRFTKRHPHKPHAGTRE